MDCRIHGHHRKTQHTRKSTMSSQLNYKLSKSRISKKSVIRNPTMHVTNHFSLNRHSTFHSIRKRSASKTPLTVSHHHSHAIFSFGEHLPLFWTQPSFTMVTSLMMAPLWPPTGEMVLCGISFRFWILCCCCPSHSLVMTQPGRKYWRKNFFFFFPFLQLT